MFLVLLLYAIFAAMTFINSSLMTSDPYPIIVGIFRALGSGIIILSYFALFNYKKLCTLKLTRYQWYLLTLYGVFVHAFAMCGFSYGALFADPISICFLYASAPFLTAIMLYLYEKESLSWVKVIGLLIGFAGLVPILLKTSLEDHFVALQGNALLGNGIVLISMIFFCLGWIFFKKLTSISAHNVQLLNGIAMLIGGFASSLFVVLQYKIGFFDPSFSNNFVYLLLLFVLTSLITYSLYAYLLQYFSPTFISFAGFLEPAFAMLYGTLFFGYGIQMIDIVSFLTLFIGLYIFYRQEL